MTTQKISANDAHAFMEVFEIEPYQEGELSNLSFAVKDSIDVINRKTGCGNPTWAKNVPNAIANAACVDQLLAHGAVCKGKTIADEITFSLDGENFHYGTPLNPKAPDRVPGGSSSGSASAVACGLVDFALGTDCGGSIRVPSSNCGIFGMRPSFGAISNSGVMPLAPSFDTVGILAREFEVLEKTMHALLCTETPFDTEIGTIYLVKEAFALADKEVSQAIEKIIQDLKHFLPGRIKEISLHMLVEEFCSIPLLKWLEMFTICQGCEIWSSHGSWVEEVHPEFSPRIQGNFDYVKHLDRSKLAQAIEKREWTFALMTDFLKPNDLLCFPTTPKLAPLKNSLGDHRYEDDYYSKTLSICSISGLCRLPEISLPLTSVDGVPIGLSLAAAHRNDAFLLSATSNIISKVEK